LTRRLLTILKPHTTKATVVACTPFRKLNGATRKADFLKMIYEEATEVPFSYFLAVEPLTNWLSSPETGQVRIYDTSRDISTIDWNNSIMEENYRVPGAFIDNIGDISWLDYAEAQHAIWASMTDLPRNDWCDSKVDSDSEWQSFPESFAQSSESNPEKDVVIAVMGVTGAGKSTFIKTVSRRNDVVVGDSLSSGSSTSPSQCYIHACK
jgi:hypothetical protein